MEWSDSTKTKIQNDKNFNFLISSNAVLESVIERIDRALPELELLENRNKWEDAVKEYNTMWTDAVKGYNTMWKDAMKG